MKIRVFLLVALVVMTIGKTRSLWGAQAASFQSFLEAAKKDGELSIWSNTPEEETMPKLLEAFNSRFGLSIKVHQVPMGSRDFTTRVLAGAQAGRTEVDLGQGATDINFILDEKSLLEDFNWVGVFGQQFPEIKRRVERVIPPFRGKVLDYWHLAYCIVYRTDRIKETDVPRTWEGLADPKWRGQLVVNQEGSPFHHIAPFWGMERALELVRKLKANQPIFAKGSRGTVVAVESGEASMGITTIGQAEFRRQKGVPLDWLTPSEIPIEIEHLIIPKGTPHPNLARLWAAWITTEGRPLFEKLTMNGLAWPEEDSFLARRLKQYGTKYRFIETREQSKMTVDAQKKLAEAILGK
jgi:iron(III) transport system substrate-binding protein